MENKAENFANENSGDFGGYPCLQCGRPSEDGKRWISTNIFSTFIDLINHLVFHHVEDVRRWREARKKQEENPFEDHVFWKTYTALCEKNGRPIAGAKQFLPVVADWLEPALASIPGLNSTESGDILVAGKLIQQASELSNEYREQKSYLMEHAEAMRDAVTDPKWPRKLGQQARFLAESMAGAKWGYKASSSREFIRKERPKTKSGIPSGRKEGRWWEVHTRIESESSQ